MKSIPGGTFMMGATPNTPYEQNEIPPHQVTLSPFYMDSTEVTQADYALLMGISPWTEYKVANASEKYPGKGNRLPAWYLTWDDAVLYCNARSKRDGMDTVYSYSGLKSGVYGSNSVLSDVKIDYTKKGYRLPTEAEWEYAARAGTYMDYYWANKEDSTAPKYARYMSEGPLPVASLRPNDFGLYDMVGNSAEFVNDYFGNYSNDSLYNPVGPASGTQRCIRGGGWNHNFLAQRIPRRLSAGSRDFNLPQGTRIVFSNK
jgi:formylglycine-generating enzyme required for sulfatase activity